MKKIFLILAALVAVGIGAYLWKGGAMLSRISTNADIFSSIVQNVPGVQKDGLSGEAEGRVNIVLLGMRGAADPAGGSLTDTIMVMSYYPATHTVTMFSIPRDLAVNGDGMRINAVYHEGEQTGRGNGLTAIEKTIGEIVGTPIHYAVKIDFDGFQQLVDALGGVTITRETEFVEPVQFHEAKVCDGDNGGVFTVPSGTYDIKRNEKGKIVAQYPMCYNKAEECGGVFTVPAGTTTLDGATALCYVRARYTSNDFDRARRQQQVIDAIQQKALSIGTLADFTKVDALMDALGDNLQTDLRVADMQRLFGFYTGKGFPKLTAQRVLEDSEEGLLYKPDGAGENGTAYILRPRGDNYDRIRALFASLAADTTVQQ